MCRKNKVSFSSTSTVPDEKNGFALGGKGCTEGREKGTPIAGGTPTGKTRGMEDDPFGETGNAELTGKKKLLGKGVKLPSGRRGRGAQQKKDGGEEKV